MLLLYTSFCPLLLLFILSLFESLILFVIIWWLFSIIIFLFSWPLFDSPKISFNLSLTNGNPSIFWLFPTVVLYSICFIIFSFFFGGFEITVVVWVVYTVGDILCVIICSCCSVFVTIFGELFIFEFLIFSISSISISE